MEEEKEEFYPDPYDEWHDKVIVEEYEKSEILQERIDKAISLLKEAGCYDEETKTFCDDVWEELPDLLNILGGKNE